MLDTRLERTIHQIQGQLITETNKVWSESKVLNLLLYVSVCHPDEFNASDMRQPIADYLKGKRLELNEDMSKKLIGIIKNDNL